MLVLRYDDLNSIAVLSRSFASTARRSLKRFLPSGLAGFYFGQKGGGPRLAVFVRDLNRDEHGVTVADIVKLYRRDATNQDLLRRVSELPSLP